MSKVVEGVVMSEVVVVVMMRMRMRKDEERIG